MQQFFKVISIYWFIGITILSISYFRLHDLLDIGVIIITILLISIILGVPFAYFLQKKSKKVAIYQLLLGGFISILIGSSFLYFNDVSFYMSDIYIKDKGILEEQNQNIFFTYFIILIILVSSVINLLFDVFITLIGTRISFRNK
ncbi:hypothetical protein [Flammeovirga sp. EKP202]|uniref:hypothetical protein n=1 Tax=Flammeovirga sp. EKP202 TaxID=2770592 RepID=UPI00165F9A08|nr:hypothetical protein [Flammeovirga sp. EKP202]MBD0404986.1 hypothetical protein [Flammeovirga sp. EKP202]